MFRPSPRKYEDYPVGLQGRQIGSRKGGKELLVGKVSGRDENLIFPEVKSSVVVK